MGAAALWAWRMHREQRVIRRRADLMAARDAAFVAILRRLSTAQSLHEILLETVQAVERTIPDCIGSIQLIEDGKIRDGASPGLPEFYNKLVDGLAIGEGVGSCGSSSLAISY